MFVRDCMTKDVELAHPDMSIRVAAQKMRDGDFGLVPIGENDRLVGTITDRDIAIRAVAEGLPAETKIREVMSEGILYCYEDQSLEEIAGKMGEHRVRRMPVLNRQKRMVGIVSLGDIATSSPDRAEDPLSQISRHGRWNRAPTKSQLETLSSN